jgi:MOSC domain-containing protein YiiM
LKVVAVHLSAKHSFSKTTVPAIELVEGHGVRGDAHFGATIKHRSRVAKTPTQPNVRQVHFIHDELLAELREKGFDVLPGQMGENVTTHGVDLLALSVGTRLLLGEHALVEVTGLRNPCSQIERFKRGLLAAVLDRRSDGALVRKTGVMGVVVKSGEVKTGDGIKVVHTPGTHVALQPV